MKSKGPAAQSTASTVAAAAPPPQTPGKARTAFTPAQVFGWRRWWLVPAGVAILWCLYPLILKLLSWMWGCWGPSGADEVSVAGQTGDMFGSLNTLFTGIGVLVSLAAYLGFLHALRMQREDLILQREEMQRTREEMQLQTKEQQKQNGMQKEVYAQQMRMMSRQMQMMSQQRLSEVLPYHRKAMDGVLQRTLPLLKQIRRARNVAVGKQVDESEEYTLDTFVLDSGQVLSFLISVILLRKHADADYPGEAIPATVEHDLRYVLTGLDVLQCWSNYVISWKKKVEHAALPASEEEEMLEDFWESLLFREQELITYSCIRRRRLPWSALPPAAPSSPEEGANLSPIAPILDPAGPSLGLFRLSMRVLIDTGIFEDQSDISSLCDTDETTYIVYRMFQELEPRNCSMKDLLAIVDQANTEYHARRV